MKIFLFKGSLKDAIAVEKRYSKHRDTESEQENAKQKSLKRKHPFNTIATNSGIDVNGMFNSTLKDETVDSGSVSNQIKKKNSTSKRNEKPKKRRLSSQANGKSKTKGSVATADPLKLMVPKNIKTVSAITSPLSAYIPNRSGLDTTHHAHTNDSTVMVPVPTVSNSVVDGHGTQLQDIRDNLDLSFVDIITDSYQCSPFVDVGSSQSVYLPPDLQSTYHILGSPQQPQGDNGKTSR